MSQERNPLKIILMHLWTVDCMRCPPVFEEKGNKKQKKTMYRRNTGRYLETHEENKLKYDCRISCM